MEITQEIHDFIESKNWDEDIKQDVYVILLEKEEGYMGDVDVAKMVTSIYNFRLASSFRKETRRRELMRENAPTIEGLQGTDDVHDPLEYLAAEETITNIGTLSPLLKKTLYGYLNGVTPEQMAKHENVSENTIYQRMHQIKKELQDGR